MDIEDKIEAIASALADIDNVLEQLEPIRDCKKIYDAMDRARLKLDEILDQLEEDLDSDI